MIYNRSHIMKTAWQYVKEKGMGMSEALRLSWRLAKNPGSLASILNTLKRQMEAYAKAHPGLSYEIKQKPWAKNGNSRTYLSVFLSEPGKKNKKRDCGYVDNIKNTYVASPTCNILAAKA